MAATKKMIQCDECQQWLPMKEDHTFSSLVIFEYPTYWFRLFGWKVDEHKDERGFCSWRCVWKFVDRKAAEEEPR